ncbi:MAG: hypothetical protein ACREM3_13500 [Candidatus Rokuibacteriota bacterium]
MSPPDWRPAIRALLYVVQFAEDPAAAADHAIEVVVDRGALGVTRDDYRSDIAAALASGEPLAKLIPQPHPEDSVRLFLGAILARL